MSGVVAQVLDWLERVMPGLISAFTLGYYQGSNGAQKLREQKVLDDLEINELKDEQAIDKEFGDKSSRDVIKTAIGNGGPVSSGDK